MRVFPAFVLVSALAACALPPEDPAAGERFVSAKEVKEIQLYNEGLAYASRQRFIEAELSFRQAEYLAPDKLSIKVNLATVLEHLTLYDEAEAMLKKVADAHDTHDLRLSDFKLQAAFGHLYASAHRFADSRKAYEQALKGATEADKPDMAAAATTARSLSAMLFESGFEEPAQCYSAQDLALKPDRDETIHHARLLIARGLCDPATQLLITFMQNNHLPKDGLLLHLLGQAAWGRGEMEEAARLESSAKDTLGVSDATAKDEIELARLLALRELAKTGKAGPENETFDDKNRDALDKLTGDEGDNWSTLYWPAAMAVSFQSWKDEQAEANKSWSLKKLF
jgi:tetratricopeptide (TPR) repeat protein